MSKLIAPPIEWPTNQTGLVVSRSSVFIVSSAYTSQSKNLGASLIHRGLCSIVEMRPSELIALRKEAYVPGGKPFACKNTTCSAESEASEKSDNVCKIRLQDKQQLSGYDRAVSVHGPAQNTRRDENK